MALRPALDLELLRTLVFIAEEASFTKAAERVGRTQSAVTLQIQKLEALVGQPLVARSKGGPVELTQQGRALVESARAMLKLNDEAFRALASHDLPATVRLGTDASLIPFYLADSLDLFRSEYPNAVVELTDGSSCQLAPHVREGAFDLVLCYGPHEPRNWQSTEVWRGPLKWITSTAHVAHLQDPFRCVLPRATVPGCPRGWTIAIGVAPRSGRSSGRAGPTASWRLRLQWKVSMPLWPQARQSRCRLEQNSRPVCASSETTRVFRNCRMTASSSSRAAAPFSR